MIKVKKCVLQKPGVIEYVENYMRIPHDGSALFRTLFNTICGSDLRIMEHGDTRISEPRALGHEIVAEVIEPGAREDLHKGDVVAIGADIPCGSCRYCKAGRQTNCSKHIAIGYQFDGGFSSHFTVSRNYLSRAPIVKIDSRDFSAAYALAEPAGCVIHGLEYSRVSNGNRILIIGSGPIGIMLSRLSEVLYGVDRKDILLVEKFEKRFKFAESIGYNVTSKLPNRKSSFDRIFTANSNPESIKRCIDYVDRGGIINFFGGLPRGSDYLNVDINQLHYREITLGGSHGSTPKHHMQAVKEIERDEYFWNNLITKKVPFNGIQEAMNSLRSGIEMKVAIEYV